MSYRPQSISRSVIVEHQQREKRIKRMFFYSDTKTPGAPQINVWKMNGTKAYLRHYENYLFLDFVSKNLRASENERRQARAELTLCEKKLEFWKRHPLYDHDEAVRGVDQLKKNWRAAA